jgi:hypothetical protein
MPGASFPPNPTWRHPDADPTALDTGPELPGWRGGKANVALRNQRARRNWLIAGSALGVLIGLGVVVYILLWLRVPPPASLVLIGARYTLNPTVPPNPYGWRGLNLLADLTRPDGVARPFGASVGLLRALSEPLELTTADPWDAALDADTRSTLVVVFALHGGIDPQGAYLLPDDADGRDLPSNRLRLETLLDRLGQLAPRRPKILVLDATQVSADWGLGLLHNDFPRWLDKLESRIAAIPNLLVMSSSALDQRSWGGDELRTTAFLHALANSLSAPADTNRDGRLDAWEWFTHAAASTTAWAQAHWGATQTPVLLPRGAEGERRARATHLAMASGTGLTEPGPANVDLERIWANVRRLESTAPAQYAPHLWRELQTLTLRAEVFARAGSSEASGQVLERATAVATAIAQAARLPLATDSITLTFPTLVGNSRTPPDEALTPGWIDEWWARPERDAANKWGELQKRFSSERGAATATRLRLARLLIERVIADPTNNLAPATRLLNLLTPTLPLAPAETHLVNILQRDLPPILPNTPAPERQEQLKLTQQVLTVRLQAEVAALGLLDGRYVPVPFVQPWLRRLIEQADTARRQGEDLALSTTSADRDRASQFLTQASADYAAARAVAEVVVEAYAVRTAAQTELPALAQWLAWRPTKPGITVRREEAVRVRQLIEACQLTHELAQRLAQPVPERVLRVSDAEAVELQQRTTELRRRLTAANEQFVAEYRAQLVERRTASAAGVEALATLVRFRHDVAAALRVPTSDLGLRSDLLAESRRAGRQLVSATNVPVPTADEQRSYAADHAQRHGLLALAVLGRGWFESSPRVGLRLSADELTFILERFAAEADGADALVRVGAQLGQAWQGLALEVDRLLIASRTRDLNAADALLQDNTDLVRADQLGRLLDGTTNARLSGSPADALRRLRTQQVLLDFTERTRADYWAALSPTAEPYYRVAGAALLTDASQIRQRVNNGPGIEQAAARLRLADTFPLVPRSNDRLALSTERLIDLRIRLERPTPERAGFPVFWLDLPTALAPVGDAAVERLARPLTGIPAEATFRLRSPRLEQAELDPSATPTPESGQVFLNGRYRGRILRQETPVEVFPQPDIIIRKQPLPERASVAVRAAPEVQERFGLTTGHLAIVLDCSGSMAPGDTAKAGKQAVGVLAAPPPSKFQAATRALSEVLAGVPRGAVVSVWVFGQAVGERKGTENAEETIQRLLPPTKWEPGDSPQLNRLMDRINQLEPWNESPIVSAMVAAKADLVGVKAFKTLLVLTDGIDNRLVKDRKLNPEGKLSVSAALKAEFALSGISVNVVGFRLADEEEEQARAQFKVVETLPVIGKFYLVRETAELIKVLRSALRQRVRYVLAPNAAGVTVPAEKAAGEMARDASNDSWVEGGLAAGAYRVEAETDAPHAQPIKLDPGDRMVVRLAGSPGNRRFERVLYTDWAGKPFWEQTDWRLAVVQNQLLPGARRPGIAPSDIPPRLQMLFVLENQAYRTADVLTLPQPREVWLELRKTGSPFSLRYGVIGGYPAPAYSLDVPVWTTRLAPNGQRVPVTPQLRCWWSPDEPAAVQASLSTTATAAGLSLLDRVEQDLGSGVLVENIRLEGARVEVLPGLLERRDCVAVRLRFPSEQPVFAQLAGLNFTNSEHRFYLSAGRYIGYFWREGATLTEAEVRASLNRLDAINVGTFKKRAEERKFYRELNELSLPSPDDVRPPPIPVD